MSKEIESLEVDRRDLLLAKAIIIDAIESGNNTLDKNLFTELGETVFAIFKIERKINQLTQNIIEP